MYQYPKQGEAGKRLAEYAGDSCLFIVGAGRQYTAVCYALQLEQFSEVLMMDVSRLPVSEYDIHDKADSIIVFVDTFLNQDEILQEVLDNTRYTRSSFLTRDTGINWEDTDEHFVYMFN